MKNNTWKKMDYSDTSMLYDHHYYLVTHKEYKTPMKAKWHSDEGGVWEVIGTTNNGRIDKEYWYSWDEQNPIIAWMEMPEIYEMEKKDR